MPKLPRLTATQAEDKLLKAGFILAAQQRQPSDLFQGWGSSDRSVHGPKQLHPKIVKQLVEAAEAIEGTSLN
jgi:predicted RNA binding protein YcfA (HicA-like mRNA interferase family)